MEDVVGNGIYCLVVLLTVLQQPTTTFALEPLIRVGAIFSKDHCNSPTELAFKYAIYNINRDKGILPGTTLIYDIQYVSKQDSFHACKKVCAQIKMGVQAIFGPSDDILGAHIHSICDALDIPHLESRIDIEMAAKEFSINLHPTQFYVNNAFLDVIRYLNWTKVGILYEKYYGTSNYFSVQRETFSLVETKFSEQRFQVVRNSRN